jgi:hypothetical protein
MPASIAASELDLFVRALKRPHGRDFSQYARASLLRRGNRPASIKPDGTVPPFTPAATVNG